MLVLNWEQNTDPAVELRFSALRYKCLLMVYIFGPGYVWPWLGA